MARKLGKRTDQRMHMLRNQVSELLWYGRIETTEDRAKEVKRLAEKMVTLGIKNYEDVVTTTKTKTNAKGESVAVEIKNDGKRKLHARRQMMSFLRDLQEIKGEKESKSAYKERTREITPAPTPAWNSRDSSKHREEISSLDSSFMGNSVSML